MLLQQLAVIGRALPLGLVHRVVSQSEDELQRLLSSLQAREFLYEQPALAEVEYIFKHALTQEVAYGTVLHEQRKTLHEKTAEAVEVLRSDNLEDHYGELAYHYSKGGNTGKAFEYLNLAGQQAAQRSSYPEAIEHLTQALELLNTLPDTRQRARQELVVQMALGTAQMVTKGYGVREVGLAYARADELCRQLGDRPELIDVLLGLWMFHVGKSEVTTAREMAEQVFRVAQEQNSPSAVLKAHIAMSHSLFFQGELVDARGHLDQCISLYDADPRHELTVSIGGVDCQVRAHCYAAWSLWLLGHPEQALASGTAALALTQDLANPFASLWVLVILASIHGWRGEVPAALEHAEVIVALAQEQGSVMCRAEGTILRSAATAGLGHDEIHVREAAEAVAILRDSAMQGWLPYYLALLAGIQCKAGHVDDALRVSGEAIEFSARLGEKWYEAELYRLKGEMILQSGGEHPTAAVRREAEACFEKALEIAKKQSARSLELRASTSLSRLWRQQGKRTEARQLLAGIYNWFTEGFDTKDLQEAKALLEELA
jgi:predicted ATPase